MHETTVARFGDDGRVGETVIYAVAKVRNVSPIELERPLFDAIDADALDRLFERGTRDMHAEFTWAGCRIDVFGDGKVVVSHVAEEGVDTRAVAES